MNKLIFILVISILPIFSIAQTDSSKTKTKIKEIGLTLNLTKSDSSQNGSLQPVSGFYFHFGNTRSMWRINLKISGDNSENNFENYSYYVYNSGYGNEHYYLGKGTVSNDNFYAFISLGKDFRFKANSKHEFVFGADINFSYTYSYINIKNEYYNIKNLNYNYGPGIDLIVGYSFLIKNKLSFGFEICPNLNLDFYKEEKINRYGFNPNTQTREGKNFDYNLDLNNFLVKVGYRF